MTIAAQLTGYPRIGPARELKWALERSWSGRLAPDDFDARIRELRAAHLDEQLGLIGSAVDDYFLYDEVLETAMMLGIAPNELAGQLENDPFAVLTALARGTPDREAWEMTKWFDTNYHYVVPEIAGLVDRLQPLPWREPTDGDEAIWPILGPYSLVKLSKLVPGLDAADVARSAGAALWGWVRSTAKRRPGFRLQVDEPSLGLVMSPHDRQILDSAYAGAGDLGLVTPPLVSVQFGAASAETLETLGSRGFAVQVPLARVDALAGTTAWASQPEHVIAVMDGRSVWPDHLDPVRTALAALPDDSRTIRLVPSTSLMFVPVTVEGEELPPGFQFAREKARRLGEWAEALRGGGEPPDVADPPPAIWPEIGEIRPRGDRAERRAQQSDLDLPPFPTTSTGSLPQTTEVRQLRVRLTRGEIDEPTYQTGIERLIRDAIAWQEA